MVDYVFLSLCVTTFSGVILACLGFAYRSKCKTINCFGVQIERDVAGEEELDKVKSSNV
jgi:hypothetical protein